MTDVSTAADPAAPAAPEAPPSPPQFQQTTPPVPTPPPAQQQQAPQDGQDPWSDPEKARAEIERLRRENGDQRIQAKQNAAMQALRTAAELAGIELPPELQGDDSQLTPEKLAVRVQEITAERDGARGEVQNTRRELALMRAAWEKGVHPSKLEYLQFLAGRDETFASIDPAASDAGAKVASTIDRLLTMDPTLRVTGSTTSSGPAGYGGAGEPTQITKEQFDAWPLDKRTELYRTDRATYDRLTGRA